MKKTELLEKAKTTKYKLNKHDMGERTITRWRYVGEKYTPFKYTFRRIELSIQFEGEDYHYKINKKDYKTLNN